MERQYTDMPKKERYKVVDPWLGAGGSHGRTVRVRANLEPLVVEGGGGDDPTDVPGGQLMLTTDVDNYPGFPEGILGPELMSRMPTDPALRGRVHHRHAHAGEPARTAVHAGAARRHRQGRRADHRERRDGALAGLPEELEFRTRMGGVSACATCDGFFYKEKHVLVVGGGDTAMEEATFLTKFAAKVTIVHRRDTLRASQIMQDRARANPKIAWLLDSAVEKILGGQGKGVTGAM